MKTTSMKTTSIKTLLGSIVVAGAIMSVPVSAFAANARASTTASFYVNGDGIVHVINAEVTSISGNIVNAISRFKNNVVTWAFNTNASTTIFANNSGVASTADIKVGDKLNVVGALNTLGTTISVNATKIKDKTSMSLWRTKTGTIQSVNLTNGTFVLKENNGKSVTVQTNANTMFSLGNESPIANVLARLMVN